MPPEHDSDYDALTLFCQNGLGKAVDAGDETVQAMR